MKEMHISELSKEFKSRSRRKTKLWSNHKRHFLSALKLFPGDLFIHLRKFQVVPLCGLPVPRNTYGSSWKEFWGKKLWVNRQKQLVTQQLITRIARLLWKGFDQWLNSSEGDLATLHPMVFP